MNKIAVLQDLAC